MQLVLWKIEAFLTRFSKKKGIKTEKEGNKTIRGNLGFLFGTICT
jgi:hypothetical protein